MPETLVRALWRSLGSCRVAEPPFRGQGPLAQARSHRERNVASNKVDRSISRVLSWTAIHLGPASPRASSDLPGPGAGHAHGSLFGLAPGGVYPATAVASGAVRSYRTFSPLPTGGPVGRYVFCGTFHRFAPSRRYLAPCPVEPGLSSAAHRGASFQDARRSATAAARPTPSKTILPRNEYGKSDCALVMGSQLKELAVIIVFPPTEKPNSSLRSGGWRQVITEYSKKLIRSDHRLRVRVPAAL